jgi:hypothetical protein
MKPDPVRERAVVDAGDQRSGRAIAPFSPSGFARQGYKLRHVTSLRPVLNGFNPVEFAKRTQLAEIVLYPTNFLYKLCEIGLNPEKMCLMCHRDEWRRKTCKRAWRE